MLVLLFRLELFGGEDGTEVKMLGLCELCDLVATLENMRLVLQVQINNYHVQIYQTKYQH